jgi:hypothetical protein
MFQEKITIRFLEKDDVSKRAVFYDKVGLIKDVFQSHIFQIMLAILDKNRDKVLSSIDFDESSLSVGQYKEYRKHEAISDKSKTETFFKGIFHFKKGVLEGVPIEVVSGKKMPKKKTEVVFKTSNGKEIVFQPKNETANAYEDVASAVTLIRKSKLPDPKIIPNAGSFFKNIILNNVEDSEKIKNLLTDNPTMPYFREEESLKIPSGWLIEQCGWKGKRVGNVGVHEKQALVIVNYGLATGEEIKNFARNIIDVVFSKFGLILTVEVNII